MIGRTTLFKLVPGKLYKHTWIMLEGEILAVPKRMPFKIEGGYWSHDHFNIEIPLIFVGKLDSPNLNNFKETFKVYGGSLCGLFICQNKLIVMEYYDDIHYEELNT